MLVCTRDIKYLPYTVLGTEYTDVNMTWFLAPASSGPKKETEYTQRNETKQAQAVVAADGGGHWGVLGRKDRSLTGKCKPAQLVSSEKPLLILLSLHQPE